MAEPQIRIRKFKRSDARSLMHHANNKNIARYMRDVFPSPYGLTDARIFIANASLPDEKTILGIDLDGDIIGATGLFPQSDVYFRNTEIGYWIGEEYWGRGYTTVAVQQMIPMAFENKNTHRLYAKIFESNIASLRILQKLGFTEESFIPNMITKFGESEGEYTYALLREDWEKRED